jgi:hypothetical protein
MIQPEIAYALHKIYCLCQVSFSWHLAKPDVVRASMKRRHNNHMADVFSECPYQTHIKAYLCRVPILCRVFLYLPNGDSAKISFIVVYSVFNFN